MAQAPNQPGDGGAQFVREIVTDPKTVPDVMLLYGYLGASSEEGHERLYLSPDLTNYVEVPKAAILYRAAAAKEQDPHGGVTLWVKKGAALIQKMAPAALALAHFSAPGAKHLPSAVTGNFAFVLTKELAASLGEKENISVTMVPVTTEKSKPLEVLRYRHVYLATR